MSLVQMSTSSTERIVRQLEVKLDRLSDMMSNGGMNHSNSSPSRRRRVENDGESGPELLSKIGDLLSNGKDASNQVDTLQEKVSRITVCCCFLLLILNNDLIS